MKPSCEVIAEAIKRASYKGQSTIDCIEFAVKVFNLTRYERLIIINLVMGDI